MPAQNGLRVSTLSVIPLPASFHLGTTGFEVHPTTLVDGDADAVVIARHALQARTGLALSVGDPAAITVEIDGIGAAESYRLTVTDSACRIAGADPAGLFYGIQTLCQLIEPAGDGWVVPAVRIDDAPRFAYRGVMLDVARHFHGVATVEAFIDRAVSLKFNHLHLHLTDDQGWRLHIPSRPELTARAAGSSVGGDPGGFYSVADYRRIVAYATDRHMTVVPEIDLPGHTHAVSVAYPHLGEPPVITDHVRDAVREYGGQVPQAGVPYDGMAVGFSSLRIRDEQTWTFLSDVLADVAALTPGPYLHVGGDEALGTTPDDFAYFLSRVTAQVVALDKTPVAWHEAGAADLAPGTVGQYWGFVTPAGASGDRARRFVAAGGRIILSPADAVYLDMKPDPDCPIGLTWAGGVTTLERAYRWEPADVIAGLSETDILGVEAPLWTETARTLEDIDILAFPRIAAAAEAAWSPASAPARSWPSFRDRVAGLGPLWASMGIAFGPLPTDGAP